MARGGFIHSFKYTEEEKKQIFKILDKVLFAHDKNADGHKKIVRSLEEKAGLLLSLGKQEQEELGKKEVREEVKAIEETVTNLLSQLHNLSDSTRDKLDIALQERYYEFNNDTDEQILFRSQNGSYPTDAGELSKAVIATLEKFDNTLGEAIRKILEENIKGRNKNEAIRSYFFQIAELYKLYTGQAIASRGTFQRFFEAILKPILEEFEKRELKFPIKPNSDKSLNEMDFSNAIRELIRGYKKHLKAHW